MVARGWPEGFGRRYFALGNCLFGCTNNAFARLWGYVKASFFFLGFSHPSRFKFYTFHLILWLDMFLAKLLYPGIWEHVFQSFWPVSRLVKCENIVATF